MAEADQQVENQAIVKQGLDHISPGLRHLAVPLEDIAPDTNNAMGHDEANIAEIARSLDRFGQRKPLVGNRRTGQTEAGAGTWLAAKKLGWQYIAVSWEDDDPEIAARFGVADNATPSADWNMARLQEIWESSGGDVPGLDETRLRELWQASGQNGNGKEPKDAPPQIDKAAELQEKWGTALGQIWQLGDHRLAVGDCTDKAVVEAVMRGEQARMIFTDPPYGIGKDIENDDLKRDAKMEFYKAWTDVALSYVIENAYVYVWGYFDTLSDYWQAVIKPRGDCNFRNFIVWKKNYIQGLTVQDFRQFPENYVAALLFIFGQPFQNGPWSTTPNAEHYWDGYEPIRAYLDGERQKMGWDIPTVKKIVGHSDLLRDHWFNRSQWSMPTREVYEALQAAAKDDAFRRDYDELRRDYDELRGHFDNSHGFTDVWEFDRLTTTDLHPTVKPVEVCCRGVISTSKPGELVLDCFLGSGSTLLACEQLGRKGRGVEISENFAAVTLQRWHDLTGREPKLL